MAVSGVGLLLDMLAEFGVRYLFGNPGTTELPLNDALVADDRFQYILGLQEVPVMAMADGLAMASGSLGVVNLHISCGLGNAMGMLYNAYREGTPLLVTAGQQDRRLRFEEPILYGEMVEVARPWTKWAAEVQRVEDLPAAVCRAAQTALTPPTGPVFLSLPIDVQREAADHVERRSIQLPDSRVRPPEGAIKQAAAALAAAGSPAILAGSRVAERNATAELVAVAERLGAPVLSESATSHGRLAFPPAHPLYGQSLPLWAPEVRDRLAEHDVLLVVGMDLLRQYVYFEPARAIPEHIRLVHLDEDPWQLGKNYPVEVGLIGDTRCGLAELDRELAGVMTESQAVAAQDRAATITVQHATQRARLVEQIEWERADSPMTPLVLMEAIARVLPDNVGLVEEAVTTTNNTLERLGAIKDPQGYFGHRGWALGWGLGCAIGAKLAWPERPVLAILGEGAAMYGIQGLWSAARYNVPVAFLIANNGEYRILKKGAKGIDLPHAQQGRYVGFDLEEPKIDFVSLAESLGVQAHRATEPEQVSHLLERAWAGDRPVLIDAPIASEE